jgi:hypothetical protein
MEKRKPNPAFRIRWGPGNTLVHRPVNIGTMEEGTLSFTKINLCAVEEVAAG